MSQDGINMRPNTTRLPPRSIKEQMNSIFPPEGFASGYVGRGTMEAMLLEAEDRGYEIALRGSQRGLTEKAREVFPKEYTAGAAHVAQRLLAEDAWRHMSSVMRTLTREDESCDVGAEACQIILLMYLIMRERRIDPNEAMERTIVTLRNKAANGTGSKGT